MTSFVIGVIMSALAYVISMIVEALLASVLNAIIALLEISMIFFMASEYMFTQYPFAKDLMEAVRVIAMSIFVLMVAFQIIKSMLSYLGFESDEPWKIGMRAIIFGFLAYYASDICFVALRIFGRLIYGGATGGGIFSYWDQINTGFGSLKDRIAENIGNFTDIGETNSFISCIFTIYLIVKLIAIIFKMGERFILMMILVISSPLAFITGVAKSTKGVLQGWIKVFSGNLILQIIQMVVIFIVLQLMSQKALIQNLVVSSTQYFTTNHVFWIFDVDILSLVTQLLQIFLCIGAINVFDRLEEVLRDISISSGIGGSPTMGPVQLMQTANQINWSMQSLMPGSSR